MGFYNFPHGRNYDSDLGFLIRRYKELENKYDALIDIYNIVVDKIQDTTIDQLQKWIDDGTIAQLINDTIFNELNEKVTQNTTDISTLKDSVSTNESNISELQTAVTNLQNEVKQILQPSITNIKFNEYELVFEGGE